MPDRIRIVNKTGNARDTEVWINGEKRMDVTAVTYSANATDDLPTATVVFVLPDVDLTGEVAATRRVNDLRMRRITQSAATGTG